ncbi:MAG TPA: hypothetical protein PKX92_10050 [Edaphocola sp.]|nr:hypothetical protein [Edaphocola sp.]
MKFINGGRDYPSGGGSVTLRKETRTTTNSQGQEITQTREFYQSWTSDTYRDDGGTDYHNVSYGWGDWY